MIIFVSCSLLPTPYSLLPAPYSLLPIPYSLCYSIKQKPFEEPAILQRLRK
ncbi:MULTISPECIES: hypothetical protein [unclassified Moorena]|uniref:hypothetical protein n=1 Tax=unclassified Moorena TaxID=2683338 RepID=UPI0013C90D2C|nr:MULTISPECIES: hypothetical protein [unclassified Moorena]NEO22336.1 hypothetical protein [Moorena sp. SIO4A5]NEQ61991.1 hypothetical protein [Moorena sp. SIO4A1]